MNRNQLEVPAIGDVSINYSNTDSVTDEDTSTEAPGNQFARE